MNLTLLLLLFTVKINLCASKEVELFYVLKCNGRITVALVFIATLCGCCSNNVACTALLCPESNIVIIKLETLYFIFSLKLSTGKNVLWYRNCVQNLPDVTLVYSVTMKSNSIQKFVTSQTVLLCNVQYPLSVRFSVL